MSSQTTFSDGTVVSCSATSLSPSRRPASRRKALSLTGSSWPKICRGCVGLRRNFARATLAARRWTHGRLDVRFSKWFLTTTLFSPQRPVLHPRAVLKRNKSTSRRNLLPLKVDARSFRNAGWKICRSFDFFFCQSNNFTSPKKHMTFSDMGLFVSHNFRMPCIMLPLTYRFFRFHKTGSSCRLPNARMN